MSIDSFQASTDRLIDNIQAFVEANVKSTGIVEADCQQLTIINALYRLAAAFNGTEAADLSDQPTDSVLIHLSRTQATALINTAQYGANEVARELNECEYDSDASRDTVQAELAAAHSAVTDIKIALAD